MLVLIWDIETYPIEALVWGIGKQELGHYQIVRDQGLLTAAWKWEGSKEVQSARAEFKDGKVDDRKLIEQLHEVLSRADVLVAHNGDEFDLKRFNARAVIHGMKPLPPIKTVDTYKVAKKYFGFTCNKLDYLADVLGFGRKIGTSFGLWIGCLKGDEKSWAKMEKYNRHDVVLLEKIYKKFKSFNQESSNVNLYHGGPRCPRCGSDKIQRRGYSYSKTVRRERYQCTACGGWSQGKFVDRSVIK